MCMLTAYFEKSTTSPEQLKSTLSVHGKDRALTQCRTKGEHNRDCTHLHDAHQIEANFRGGIALNAAGNSGSSNAEPITTAAA